MSISALFAILAGFLNYFVANLAFFQWINIVIRMIVSWTLFMLVFLGWVFMIYGKETLKEIFKKWKPKNPDEIGVSELPFEG
jgi:hypothetical protein